MSGKIASAPREFVLFVDTNRIWTKEENTRIDFVHQKFEQSWNKIAEFNDAKLVIPEVVFLEIASQKFRNIYRTYQTARSDIANIHETLSIPDLPAAETREKIQQQILTVLEEKRNNLKNCIKIPTPTNKITAGDLDKIVEASIWRLPPFKNSEKESGFRDALILETVKYFHKESIHSNIALLTNDELLKQAAKKLFEHVNNFEIFTELEDFENYLTAVRNKISPEFINNAISLASQIFYNPDEQTGLWIELREKILPALNLKVGEFGYDSSDTARTKDKSGIFGLLSTTYYTCATDPMIKIRSTKFLSVIGKDEFHWSSTVIISCKYSRPTSLLFDNQEAVKERLIVLEIIWKSKLSEQHEFSDIKMLKPKKEHDRYYDLDENALEFFEDIYT